MEILEVVTLLLKEYALCDNCLGRQFAMLGHGLTNDTRGRVLKLVSILEANRQINEEDAEGKGRLLSIANHGFSHIAIESLKTLGLEFDQRETTCYLCRGALTRIDEIAKRAVKELSKYEYDSFLVGIKTEVEVEDREDELRSKFNIKWGENIRNEFSREIGKRIMLETKKNVDMKKPDILVVINPFKGIISLEVNPLFIYGRYQKLVRGIPQSTWICSECRGTGCQKCEGSGKLYLESVEELIGIPLLEFTKGNSLKLHASGREDIDVRALGSGRPFVMEVSKPKLRKIDLERLKRTIEMRAKGKIKVFALKFSTKKDVRNIKKAEKAVKVYRAVVEFARKLSEEEIDKLGGFGNRLISQLTPTRVSHRRAVKTRKRYLYGVEVKKLKSKNNIVEMWIRCQGGLYIKELITGDGGRTKPNVFEVIGVPVKCLELDVMKVELEGY